MCCSYLGSTPERAGWRTTASFANTRQPVPTYHGRTSVHHLWQPQSWARQLKGEVAPVLCAWPQITPSRIAPSRRWSPQGLIHRPSPDHHSCRASTAVRLHMDQTTCATASTRDGATATHAVSSMHALTASNWGTLSIAARMLVESLKEPGHSHQSSGTPQVRSAPVLPEESLISQATQHQLRS